MHFAVLAAGKGNRLAREGFPDPKPLAKVGGRTLTEHLLDSFKACGAQSVTFVTNPDMPEVESHIRELAKGCSFPVRSKAVKTEAPTQTLAELLKMVPAGKVMVTTVDTLYPAEDFESFVREFGKADSPEVLMPVTQWRSDEGALYVHTDNSLNITAFSSAPAPMVSAGIYGLGPEARTIAGQCYQQGKMRLRQFQQALLEAGLEVRAYPIGVTFDIDRPSDLYQAEAYLQKTKPAATGACY